MIHQRHFCVGVQKVKRRRKKIKVSPKFLPLDSSLNQSATFSSFSSQKQSCLKGLGYITDVNFLCSFSSVQTDWQRVIERSCSLPPFLTRPPPHCCLSLVLLPLGEEVGLAPVPSHGNDAQNPTFGWWSHPCTTGCLGLFSAAQKDQALPWSLDTCSSCRLPLCARIILFLSVPREQGDLGLCLQNWKGSSNPFPSKLLSNGIAYGM